MKNDDTEVPIRVTHKQIVGLYLHLKAHEFELDVHQSQVLSILSTVLFDFMSIEEMESLEHSYANGSEKKHSGDGT